MEPLRARANYFRLEQSPAGASKLSCKTSAGRAGEPRTVFQSGTIEGDAVIKMLKNTEGYVCSDIEQEQPPGWDKSRQPTYRSFIAVPCRTSAEVWGMLTVDAPEANSLSDDDLPLLRVLGRIIAIAVILTKNPE